MTSMSEKLSEVLPPNSGAYQHVQSFIALDNSTLSLINALPLEGPCDLKSLFFLDLRSMVGSEITGALEAHRLAQTHQKM